MSIKIKDGKLIYHLTTLKSLPSIIKNGLISRRELSKRKIKFTDTADPNIINERKRLDLSGYIPFHFHTYTAYDTAVKNKYGSGNFIYLCLRRTYARNNKFKILPIHPTSLEQPKLYSYDEGFEKIDWNTMELTKDKASYIEIEERYRKQVRMAECLSPCSIPIGAFQSIIVKNSDTKKKVKGILNSYNIDANSLYIDVKEFYF